MKFHVADTLTGRIVGRLYPGPWSITDPLNGVAEATLNLPQATNVRDIAHQVVIEASDGTGLFGGPVPTRPTRAEDGTVQIRAIDWRGWWNRARIWPNSNGTRRDYFATNREQATILTELAQIGLTHPAAPRMAIDTPAATGVTRSRVVRMWESIGEAFTDIAKAERGPDWFTYVLLDGLTVTPHVAFGFPYRTSRSTPIRLEYKLGDGGNVHNVTWPTAPERPNLVAGLGSAAPPDQGWAIAEHDRITSTPPVEIVWPQTMSLPSGTLTADSAFEYALARLEAFHNEDGIATVTVDPTRPRPADYTPGDLARLVVDDGWRSVDLATTRILSRTITGVGDTITEVTLSLDLGFNPDNPDDDGEVVTDVDLT